MSDKRDPRKRRRLLLPVIWVLLATATAGWFLFSAQRDSSVGAGSAKTEAAPPAAFDASPSAFRRGLDDTATHVLPEPAAWRERATRAYSDIENQAQPLDTPLAPRIDDLRRRARAGDVEAAAQLHIELFRCSELPGQLESLDEFVEGGSSSTWIGNEQQTLQFQESALEQIEADATRCAGVSEVQRAEQYRWLEVAAQAGDANSALLYANVGSPLLNDATEMLRDPQGVLAFKRKATRFVMQAAQRCNVEALGFVGRGYDSGIWFPRDAELGAAFSLVALRLSQGYAPSPHPGDRDMSQPVEQLAARIYTQYCL